MEIDKVRRLHDLADVLEQGANSLALFAHYAQHGIDAPDDTSRSAVTVAMALIPDEVGVLNLAGIDTRRLRHVASSALLRLASLARTRGATSVADAGAASQLAHELLSAANHVRIEATGLE